MFEAVFVRARAQVIQKMQPISRIIQDWINRLETEVTIRLCEQTERKNTGICESSSSSGLEIGTRRQNEAPAQRANIDW